MSKIKIFVKPANQPAGYLDEIEAHSLEDMHKIVGGWIERFEPLIGHGIVGVCNEEGLLIGLSLNFMRRNDPIVGDVFFCGEKIFNLEDGPEFISLTDEQVEILKNKFGFVDF